jgi:hypothetical protein
MRRRSARTCAISTSSCARSAAGTAAEPDHPSTCPMTKRSSRPTKPLRAKLALKVLSGSFTERGQAARELDMWARRVTGVAKARHVAAYVKILLEAKTPIILGGWHRDVYDIWLKELAPYNPQALHRLGDAAKRTRSSAPSWRAIPTASSCPCARVPASTACSIAAAPSCTANSTGRARSTSSSRGGCVRTRDPIRSLKSTSSPTAEAIH